MHLAGSEAVTAFFSGDMLFLLSLSLLRRCILSAGACVLFIGHFRRITLDTQNITDMMMAG